MSLTLRTRGCVLYWILSLDLGDMPNLQQVDNMTESHCQTVLLLGSICISNFLVNLTDPFHRSTPSARSTLPRLVRMSSAQTAGDTLRRWPGERSKFGALSSCQNACFCKRNMKKWKGSFKSSLMLYRRSPQVAYEGLQVLSKDLRWTFQSLAPHRAIRFNSFTTIGPSDHPLLFWYEKKSHSNNTLLCMSGLIFISLILGSTHN